MSKVKVRKYERTDEEILLWWNSLNDRQRKLCIKSKPKKKEPETIPMDLSYSNGLPENEYWSNDTWNFTKVWISKSSYKIIREKI